MSGGLALVLCGLVVHLQCPSLALASSSLDGGALWPGSFGPGPFFRPAGWFGRLGRVEGPFEARFEAVRPLRMLKLCRDPPVTHGLILAEFRGRS